LLFESFVRSTHGEVIPTRTPHDVRLPYDLTESIRPNQAPRFAITGGPNAGKSTVIDLAAEAGHVVLPEMATQVIRAGHFHPQRHHSQFQREVYGQQLEQERSLPADRLCFMDRGLADAAAYKVMLGEEPISILNCAEAYNYMGVFLFEALPTWESNGVRYEDTKFAQDITDVLADTYSSRGVPVIFVPIAPPQERLNFVLSVANSMVEVSTRKAVRPFLS